MAYRLGIDFGTSTTVAMLAGPDDRTRPLLFDASPLLPSAVFAGPGTGLVTGADAERAALTYPPGLERHPKRRIDDGTLWLGEQERPVVEVVAALFSRIAEEARRVAGELPQAVTFTHPATWRRARIDILAEAAGRAGFTDPAFVTEPAAAATYFAVTLGERLAPGRCLLVYDFGAGTFDVSIVRAMDTGLEVVASAGLDDAGGRDLDALVVAHARDLTADAAGAWGRLEWPETDHDRQQWDLLWQGARAAKEMLSRHASADVYVPLVDRSVHLTREEFEKAARPLLDRTVETTLSTLRASRIPADQVRGVFLVGGSSRVPLAATMLHQRLRVKPVTIDQPELVVAEGSLLLQAPPTPEPEVPVPAEAPVADVQPEAAPAPQPFRSAPAPRRLTQPRLAHILTIPPPGEQLGVHGIAFAPQADVLALCDMRNTVHLWDVQTGAYRATLAVEDPRSIRYGEFHKAHNIVRLGDLSFSPDGRVVASSCLTTEVHLWDWARDRHLGQLGHTDAVLGIAFSPDGRQIATACADRAVRLWNAETGEQQGTLDGHTGEVVSVVYSPSGRTLATTGPGGTVAVWDAASGAHRLSIPAETQLIAFAPSGNVLACGVHSAIYLWDLDANQVIRTLEVVQPERTGWRVPRTSLVCGLGFAPDGDLLFSAYWREAVRVWDPRTGRLMAKFADDKKERPEGDVLALDPNGRFLATRSRADAILLWDSMTETL